MAVMCDVRRVVAVMCQCNKPVFCNHACIPTHFTRSTTHILDKPILDNIPWQFVFQVFPSPWPPWLHVSFVFQDGVEVFGEQCFCDAACATHAPSITMCTASCVLHMPHAHILTCTCPITSSASQQHLHTLRASSLS